MTMKTSFKESALPTVDAVTLTIDAQLITAAGSYPSSVPSNTGNYASIDLGAGITTASHLHMNILPSSSLAGGTNLTYKLYGSADNATFVLVATSNAIALASLGQYRMELPGASGYQYWQLVVTSVGTFTAGDVTAWIN